MCHSCAFLPPLYCYSSFRYIQVAAQLTSTTGYILRRFKIPVMWPETISFRTRPVSDQKNRSWFCYFGLGLKNLVSFTSMQNSKGNLSAWVLNAWGWKNFDRITIYIKIGLPIVNAVTSDF